MKKSILIAAVFAAATSVNASAQVYAGATVGSSRYDLDCAGVTSCKTGGTALKVLAGYQVTPLFALEATYFDLGKISGKELGFDVSGGATGVDFSGVARMQLTQDIGMFARVGIAHVEGKITGKMGTKSETFKHSSTQPVFGVGSTYNINKNLRVRAEFEMHRAKVARDGDTVRVANYSLGLENSF